MANEEQLSILKQGVEAWNKWRQENPGISIDLRAADLRGASLEGARLATAHLDEADLRDANLRRADLAYADLIDARLNNADLGESALTNANFGGAALIGAKLTGAVLNFAYLFDADLSTSDLTGTSFYDVWFTGARFTQADIGFTRFNNVNLGNVTGLNEVNHLFPSTIGMDTLVRSAGNIPEEFLRGCGLSDWEIEVAKLYRPDLSNEEINNIQYRLYALRAARTIQVSPLFISYSHADREFVDKVGRRLTGQGIRFWRDIHEMKAGRMETQIDRAIRQNPTVLLVLSEHSLSSDWVEHEVRTARELEKDMGRDVLCPLALDDSWKSSRWPARVMEQIKEYNILDFSEWQDDGKFDRMFRKLIDGLELFYKG